MFVFSRIFLLINIFIFPLKFESVYFQPKYVLKKKKIEYLDNV